MLFDKENLFSDGQSITESAASENVLSTQGVLSGLPYVPIKIQVIEAFKELTSLSVEVQTSETEDFAEHTTLVSTGDINADDLTEGAVIPIDNLPKRGNLGYMRLYYNVDGTATAGKITAGVIAGDDFSYQDM